MRSPAGTEAPLRLVCGSDLRLRRLRWLLAAVGTGAILLTSLPTFYRLTLALCPLILVLWIGQRGYTACRLELKSDGQCQLDGKAGTLSPDAWLSRYYAVLRVRVDMQTHSLLISASRQANGEYRKLLGWMRLQPWTSD